MPQPSKEELLKAFRRDIVLTLQFGGGDMEIGLSDTVAQGYKARIIDSEDIANYLSKLVGGERVYGDYSDTHFAEHAGENTDLQFEIREERIATSIRFSSELAELMKKKTLYYANIMEASEAFSHNASDAEKAVWAIQVAADTNKNGVADRAEIKRHLEIRGVDAETTNLFIDRYAEKSEAFSRGDSLHHEATLKAIKALAQDQHDPHPSESRVISAVLGKKDSGDAPSKPLIDKRQRGDAAQNHPDGSGSSNARKAIDFLMTEADTNKDKEVGEKELTEYLAKHGLKDEKIIKTFYDRHRLGPESYFEIMRRDADRMAQELAEDERKKDLRSSDYLVLQAILSEEVSTQDSGSLPNPAVPDSRPPSKKIQK